MRLFRNLFFMFGMIASAFGGEPSPLWSVQNVDAWCIVPFDAKKRTPAERGEMLEKLGIKKMAYDWRDNDVPFFEQEIQEYQKRGIEFLAFWSTHEKAFELFEKYNLHPQIWVIAASPDGASNEEKTKKSAVALWPLVERTQKAGCKLAIYNHGGWSGEPENMVAIVEYLRKNHQATNVGIVYNFHHGHEHVARFAAAWKLMQPYLLALNLNGMETDGEARGHKILTLSQGDNELEMMRIVERSGWKGPVGIINHRPELDAEIALRDNLKGLAWLRAELADPGSGGARPFPRPEQVSTK